MRRSEEREGCLLEKRQIEQQHRIAQRVKKIGVCGGAAATESAPRAAGRIFSRAP